MQELEALLAARGYALLFAVGFVEFAGLPLASAPLLVLAGAFAAQGTLSLPGAIAAAVLGGLTADLAWYALARRRGAWALGMACGLASNPTACAVGLRDRIERLGPRSVLTAKLLPGFANLAAPAAGLARVALPAFLGADLAGLLFWAGVDVGLGWLFAGQVALALAWLGSYTRIALGAALLLFAGAVAWRVVKLRLHRRMHPAPEPDEGGLRPGPEPG